MAAAATGVRASAIEPLSADVAVEAARGLYESHARAIFRFCRSRLRSREEAEDAAQTTFLYAFRALRKGDVPVSELSWLLKIAENVCKTRRHDARRRLALEVAEDPEQLGRVAAPSRPEPELLMPLGDALGRLTERQRQALLLREWQGLSYREIAERLGIGQGAVEVLIFRARRALAEELETPGAVRRRQRARALDLGWLAGLAKQFLGGGIAAKATLAAIAAGVVAAVSTVAVAVADAPRRDEPVRPAGPPPAAPSSARDADVRRSPRPASPAVERAKAARAPAEARTPTVPAPLAESSEARPEATATPRAAPAEQAPPVTAADETVAKVSDAVDPVVATVESTVAPVVGGVESVVEEVVATAEAGVPSLPSVPDAPALPAAPALP